MGGDFGVGGDISRRAAGDKRSPISPRVPSPGRSASPAPALAGRPAGSAPPSASGFGAQPTVAATDELRDSPDVSAREFVAERLECGSAAGSSAAKRAAPADPRAPGFCSVNWSARDLPPGAAVGIVHRASWIRPRPGGHGLCHHSLESAVEAPDAVSAPPCRGSRRIAGADGPGNARASREPASVPLVRAVRARDAESTGWSEDGVAPPGPRAPVAPDAPPDGFPVTGGWFPAHGRGPGFRDGHARRPGPSPREAASSLGHYDPPRRRKAARGGRWPA